MEDEFMPVGEQRGHTRYEEANHISYTGNYPDPRQLADYEEAVPGSALRLVELAAEAERKRLEIQGRRQRTRNLNSTLGILCAFFIAGLTIGAGYVVLAEGATLEGLTLSGTGVAGLVLAFIRSTDDPPVE